MVLRAKSRKRKLLGARRWGAGNIKNHRGAGDRGGRGEGGRKHKMTYIVKYEKGKFGSVGFHPWGQKSLKEITLRKISELAAAGNSEKLSLEFKGYKVLGSGNITVPVTVKATSFSKSATEKISKAGGEAVPL